MSSDVALVGLSVLFSLSPNHYLTILLSFQSGHIPDTSEHFSLQTGHKTTIDATSDNRIKDLLKPQKLMDTKQKALMMMAKGMGTSEVANRLGVSQRTVQRWIKSEGVGNPMTQVCQEVVKNVAVKVEAVIGDDLQAQAIKLLRLSGKSLDCLEQIIDNPDTRTADKLTACKIVGDWVGFQSRDTLLTHTLGKYGLEVAITPEGEKTLQQPAKKYPLERGYEFVCDSQGNTAGISKISD
jgi:predicted transcriptional regulator